MPTIKSQLGDKSVEGYQRKVLTVEDESGNTGHPPPQGYEPIDPRMQEEPQQPRRRRRTYGQQAQAKSVLTNDQRHEYGSQKRDVYAQQSRISSANKNRIEILLGIGRLTKEVEYDEVIFSLQSLKSREMREIFDSIKDRKVNDLDINYEIRAQTLARSLYEINGHSFEDFIGSRSVEDKMAFIDELQERTVTFLHEKYSEMVDENKEKFKVENKEDAEEVIENIKK